jgi:hypothetical protein
VAPIVLNIVLLKYRFIIPSQIISVYLGWYHWFEVLASDHARPTLVASVVADD